MEGLAGLAVILAGMVVVYSLILRTSPRTGRAGWKDPIGKMGTPTSRVPDMILGLLALAHLGTLSAGSAGTNGAALGLVLGLTLWAGLVRSALSIVGVLAAVAASYAFLTDPGQSLSLPLRLILISLVVLCLTAGMLAGLLFLGRSARIFSFGSGRGLAFFGLVEFVTFLVSPAGADLADLEPGRLILYLAVGCLGAAGLGMIFGPIVLWILGGALAAVTLAFPAQEGLVVYLLSGVVTFTIGWWLVGRRLAGRRR